MMHIYAALKILDSRKEATILLPYSTYRTLFSSFEVEPIEEIYDKNNNLTTVRVDRLKAMEYLQTTYNFIRSKDLPQRIKEAAHDLSN